jgi:phage-related protein
MASFAGDTPCWVPDTPVGREEKWRMNVAKFGDGYEQRTLDGINALEQKWICTWEMRTKAVTMAMEAYWVAQKGNAFQFREPATGVMYEVFCDEWKIDWVMRRKGPSPVNPLYYATLSAEFRKANGITV